MYEHLESIAEKIYDDTENEAINLPFVSHNNRFYAINKANISFDDFI